MTSSTNIAVVTSVPTKEADKAYEPTSIGEAMRLAGLLVASRLIPKSITTPEAAFVVMATGRELGLTTMQSFRTIHVIDGKPSLSADLILGLVKTSTNVCSYFVLVESTDQIAKYKTQRIGEPSPTEMAFSIADAKKAGIADKDNWRKYPAAMLRARAITQLARAVYPDIVMGLYDPDELRVPDDAAPSHETDAALDVYVARVAAAADRAELSALIDEILTAQKSKILGSRQVDILRANWVSRRDILRTNETAIDAPDSPSIEAGAGV